MIECAYLEGDPVLLGEIEAWTCINGEWRKMNHVDAFCKARLLSAEQFESMFPKLPLLPVNAFTSESA